ncbi:hypothetical protein CONPUDRAFT_154693 [Coniophora puteana RWD-64-598 SS2]|uniref:CxC2-like cysteine cluster KDZ transposase-associated domain-containing protein n=1 Tax=Coniophora puteana (strain RWD-64-598) TaxID=741705 RepID=A0A5M3MNE8_CONPW|nr:uncharacterized protein CONPUDRAFT_154693 [Coniophora puteana RWD-64-598 SS2]EIW80679.1 hypothetical protein CONPUDRAFT_154693 [Coniophora puteana RWD-64-598 SS2]
MGHSGQRCPSNPPPPEPAASTSGERPPISPDNTIFNDVTPESIDQLAAEYGLCKRFSQVRGIGADAKDDDLSPARMITVVDVTGLYEFPIVWCKCSVRHAPHEQLLRMRLYPASQDRPQTVFTFDVLDHFLLANMETKVPANAYFRMLMRITDEAYPDLVPDRYRELARCARQWLRLTSRKRHGHGYGEDEDAPGSLATPCVACPRPGINAPAKPDSSVPSWLSYLHLVVDGNFKQQNFRMRKPENDVPLTDGLQYTVKKSEYEAHLATVDEVSQRSTCNDHRAVSQANSRRAHLLYTGLAGVACARHGFWISNAIVDLLLGERQISIDAITTRAIWLAANLAGVVLFYDIICQYFVKFFDRVKNSPLLSLPDGPVVIPAIGLFHVHGHQDQCVAYFSPDFIRGVGKVAGEMIESMWPPLNNIADSARHMAESGRRDLINGHMDWENMRKMYNSVKYCCTRFLDVLDLLERATKQYVTITNKCAPEEVERWTQMLDKAYEDRTHDIKANEVFNVKISKLPSRAENEGQLANSSKVKQRRGANKAVVWVSKGIDILQLQIKATVLKRRIRDKERGTDAKTLAADRKQLRKLIPAFLAESARFLGALADEVADESSHGDAGDDDWDDIADMPTPEDISIKLPSAFGRRACFDNGLEYLVDIEAELRRGQAHDALEKTRSYIGKKSVLYRTDIRQAKGSQKLGKAAQDVVDIQNSKIATQRETYNNARKAMIALAESPDDIAMYKELTFSDLEARTSTLNPAERGLRDEGLPWIWTMDIQEALAGKSGDEVLNEFYRLHWMKAKCRKDRAEEEIVILRHEMERIPLSFAHEAKEWDRRAAKAGDNRPGHVAHARRQRKHWERLAQMANSSFARLLAKHPPPSYINLWLPAQEPVTATAATAGADTDDNFFTNLNITRTD